MGWNNTTLRKSDSQNDCYEKSVLVLEWSHFLFRGQHNMPWGRTNNIISTSHDVATRTLYHIYLRSSDLVPSLVQYLLYQYKLMKHKTLLQRYSTFFLFYLPTSRHFSLVCFLPRSWSSSSFPDLHRRSNNKQLPNTESCKKHKTVLWIDSYRGRSDQRGILSSKFQWGG